MSGLSVSRSPLSLLSACHLCLSDDYSRSNYPADLAQTAYRCSAWSHSDRLLQLMTVRCAFSCSTTRCMFVPVTMNTTRVNTSAIVAARYWYVDTLAVLKLPLSRVIETQIGKKPRFTEETHVLLHTPIIITSSSKFAVICECTGGSFTVDGGKKKSTTKLC